MTTTKTSTCPAPPHKLPVRVCLDVEVVDKSSRDIDDTLLLLLIAGDPRFDLRAVTLTPGTEAQVAITRRILTRAGRSEVPVGVPLRKENISENPLDASTKESEVRNDLKTNSKHESQSAKRNSKNGSKSAKINSTKLSDAAKYLGGDIPSSLQQDDAAELLCRVSDKETVIITGSQLTNVANALQQGMICRRWVGQGGFASSSVLPEQIKADDIETTTSYNLNKDKAAFTTMMEAIEEGKQISEALFVSSKRHADESNQMSAKWQARLKVAAEKQAAGAIVNKQTPNVFSSGSAASARKETLELFLELCSLGYISKDKKLHDVLLLAVVLEPSVCSWTNGVEVYHAGEGKWGSRMHPNQKEFPRISYCHDPVAYLEVVLPLPTAMETVVKREEAQLLEAESHQEVKGNKVKGKKKRR
eukprot:m.85084 g.85084  ORF g.85084 m.85084 type:complete len:418 (-) comp12994_c0_seq1:862-2115(-)